MTLVTPKAHLRYGDKVLDEGSGGFFDHRHPFTQQVQARIPLAGAKEVDEAVELADSVAGEWRRWSPEARRNVLNKLADLLLEHRQEFAELAALDGGTPTSYGLGGVDNAVNWTRYYAGWCDKLSGELLSTLDTRGQFAYTAPEPYGVVGIIITWNGPLISLGMKVAPALAAGNCVVVKPSEFTPFAPDLFARLVREAGIPDGVCSILSGGMEAGEALVAHPKVKKISFTGGPVAARHIMRSCAELLKPAVLELGGKSAALVFPDGGDLDMLAARALRWSIGVFAGQGCVLPTRLLVHEDIYDDLLDKLVEQVRGYKVGDPFDPEVTVGPLINAAAVERVCGMLDRARSEGAGRIVFGGGRPGGELADKNFVEPTIIADADPEHEIAQVEIFGPVLLVMKFSTEDEAVELANATPYGLGAFIHSTDLTRVHRLAERLNAGGIYVNGAKPNLPHTPFGGLGLSGFGKEGGRAGIDEFVHYKTVSIVENI
ncbi:aldehyde dehydrogenase [Nocardia abscessus]|jgi:aldehyde dehydrogenase (NAD+)|uniref:aldehyde dehydrogenase family protein n=1 Tax=Nocardia TaxID=1817 RepID=UPI0018938143|nr:aldehyde dehydrogenase family protein [Nocardia abscessus]MBF6207389.1 aldehyde dehydrogenase [Streptomyces gardneri]MBF6472426.1 aldehyde dehydrogenase [Nocardia abscessus]